MYYTYVKTASSLEKTVINLHRIFGNVKLCKHATTQFVDKHVSYLLHNCKFCINTISCLHLIKDDKRLVTNLWMVNSFSPLITLSTRNTKKKTLYFTVINDIKHSNVIPLVCAKCKQKYYHLSSNKLSKPSYNQFQKLFSVLLFLFKTSKCQ